MALLKSIKENIETWGWLQSKSISLGWFVLTIAVGATGTIGYFKYIEPMSVKINYIPILVERVDSMDVRTKNIQANMLTKADVEGVAEYAQIKNISDSLTKISNDLTFTKYRVNVIYNTSPELQDRLEEFLTIMKDYIKEDEKETRKYKSEISVKRKN